MKLQAGIVETRCLQGIRELVDNHLQFLPHGTQIVFFHSPDNYEFLKKKLKGCDIKYVNTSVNSLSASAYNNLLTRVDFWQFFDAEKVLIFQHDTMLLRTGIDDFYHLDFIGAPLYHIPFPCMNGGFSLRDKQAMIKVCSQFKYDESKDGNEDIFFCKKLAQIGGELPIRKEADLFACETIETYGTIGIHAIEKWFSKDIVIKIITQYKK